MLTGLYRPVFQTGYVTHDLDRAMELFAKTQGVRKWFRPPTGRLPVRGGGELQVEIAMALLGGTMIEIIACKGGNDQLYSQILPDDRFAVRLHHLGFRLDSDAEWDEMLALGQQQGYAVAMDVKTSSTRALYYDTRETLGHYIEYLHYFDEPNSSLPRVPQNLV